MPKRKDLFCLKNNYGYSLAELMIVVAIVGILGTYANFNYSSSDAKLKQASRELYTNLQSARLEAIKKNTDWGIVFNSADNSYSRCAYSAGACTGDNTTIDLDGYGSGVEFGSGDATKNAKTTPDLSPFDTISYATDSVYFDSKGLNKKKGYVYLENNTGTVYAISTPYLTGNIIIKKWRCTTRDAGDNCTDGAWEQ